eukprot:12541792-Alexandrium_andersonii.AAC.1
MGCGRAANCSKPLQSDWNADLRCCALCAGQRWWARPATSCSCIRCCSIAGPPIAAHGHRGIA